MEVNINANQLNDFFRAKKGHVYLVGAGPGDIGLLTIKALQLIQSADVIFYDALVSPEIMALVTKNTEIIYVGKEDGFHSVEQDQINQKLVDAAKCGKSIIRLKGGDPFVFGRGGEEAIKLQTEHIPFEIVPGISSSIAAATYAGIPLTHRNIADSFVVVTGHSAKSDLNFQRLEKIAQVDTIVLLMAVKNRSKIAHALISFGRSPMQAVAFIENATTKNQKVLISNLIEVAESKIGVQQPAVMIVGDVVNLSTEIAWFNSFKNYQKKITLINEYQKNFPITETPFNTIALENEMTESEVVESFKELIENNSVGRIGAIITPNSIGISELVAISVPPQELDRVAAYVNTFTEVNHNYEREHKYNLWFVVTAISTDRLESVINEIEVFAKSECLRLPLLQDYHIDLAFDIK